MKHLKTFHSAHFFTFMFVFVFYKHNLNLNYRFRLDLSYVYKTRLETLNKTNILKSYCRFYEIKPINK